MTRQVCVRIYRKAPLARGHFQLARSVLSITRFHDREGRELWSASSKNTGYARESASRQYLEVLPSLSAHYSLNSKHETETEPDILL